MDSPAPADAAAREDRPPLGSWRRMYALVLAVLAVEIAVFALIGNAVR